MSSPLLFRFPANLTPSIVSRTNKCRTIDHDPLDQLNWNSCFLHRDTSVKLPSVELDFTKLSLNPSHSNQIDPRFTFRMSQNPRKPILLKSRCIGCLATIVVREKRTSDSSSPNRITPGKPVFDEIRVYRLPSNHCRRRETDLGFEFPKSNYPRETRFRWNPGVSVA